MKKTTYILLFAVVLIAVGVLFYFFNSSSESPSSSTIESSMEISEVEIEPSSTESEEVAPPVQKPTKKAPSNVTTSTRNLSMSATDKAALSTFRQHIGESSRTAVRVVHFGDSQIEGDRITCAIRHHLQDQYGGGGIGLIPLVKRVNYLTNNQKTTINGAEVTFTNGLKTHMIYGRMEHRREGNKYGPMGMVQIMNNALFNGSEDVQIAVSCKAYKGYKTHPFDHIRLLTTDSITAAIITPTQEDLCLNQMNVSPRNEITLRLRGKGEVYGISLESKVGIIVDNIAMRGSSGLIFTGINKKQLANFFEDTNTRLIILQYGGNMVPLLHNDKEINNYISKFQKQIAFLRSCCPDASFIFIGPSDMYLKVKGVSESHPIIPHLDKALEKFCAQNDIAYWSLFRSMGGPNSMITWMKKNWAGGDGIHFTRKGSNVAGDLFWQWLEQGL